MSEAEFQVVTACINGCWTATLPREAPAWSVSVGPFQSESEAVDALREYVSTSRTLADFLLARIEDDEARFVTPPFDRDGRRASKIHYETCPSLDPNLPYPCDCNLAARVLADCEAHRRIVELHVLVPGDGLVQDTCETCQHTDWTGKLYGDYPCPTLRALAQPYAGHQEFREEWRL